MSTYASFGEYLRGLRKAAGLDQRELARRVDARLLAAGGRGFDVTYLSKIENGRVEPPSAEAVRALAEELQVDPDSLLAYAGKVPPEVGRTLRESAGARLFYRSIRNTKLTDDEWAALVEEAKRLQEDR
jgi:transcriptional regulator with XRE-family HTH domain